MPAAKPRAWPSSRHALLELGEARVRAFCLANKLPIPPITPAGKEEWPFDACAYYRPRTGIVICVEHCARPAGEEQSRNWSWPGSKTDRTPYGVVAHELGHHLDWLMGGQKGSYWSDFGAGLRRISREEPISGYCPNDAEWFAEMARLFITNATLLAALRPLTYAVFLGAGLRPVSPARWREQLGSNVPARVARSLVNMGAP
jgi:hypothetical protein